MIEQIINQQPQELYRTRDLDNLSVVVLYNSNLPSPMNFIEDGFRYDNHSPFGPHLNYEIWMPRIGKDTGRNSILSNTHIPLMTFEEMNKLLNKNKDK